LRSKRSFVISIAACATLVAVFTLPASQTYAAESISASPSEVEVGDYVDVVGDGFSECHKVFIYLSNEALNEGDLIGGLTSYEILDITYTDCEPSPSSYFSISPEIPASLTDGTEDLTVYAGQYYLYATESKLGEILARERITVIGGQINLNQSKRNVGMKVEVEGMRFTENKGINITYDDVAIEIVSGDKQVDREGQFSSAFVIPGSCSGVHEIIVTDESGCTAFAAFTVESALQINSMAGLAGELVTVKGNGFSSVSGITVTFGGSTIATTPLAPETSEYGNFTTNFTVPNKNRGTYEVIVKDEDGNRNKFEFAVLVEPVVSISPLTNETSPGHVGTELRVTGASFNPDSPITVIFDESIVIANTMSDAKGAMTAAFEIPRAKAGKHDIVVTDGTFTAQVSIVMESQPPPAPAPTMPIGENTNQQAHFEWQTVGDLSGVTYVFQVATDKDFALTPVTLEKKGLVRGDYTLSQEEALEPSEAPYYWRVKAIDGADNESAWSETAAFHVFSTRPGRGTYTLIGIGAAALAFLGYWLAKKRIKKLRTEP